MEHQQPWFDILTAENPERASSGAVRAWVSLPVGAGKGHVSAVAIKNLYDRGAVRRVLYVAAAPRPVAAQQLASVNMPTRVLTEKPGEALNMWGVDVVSPEALYAGYDTWIKYGAYDLIVLDLHRNPLLGTPRQRRAAHTILGMDTKVWLVGCGV
jgi:hypothetical protein